MKDINTRTTDTFTTADGKTVRYQDVFDGIAASVKNSRNRDGEGLSPEDMEDAFQDAAYKAVRSHGSYKPTLSAPQTYGSRIAANCAKDIFRKDAQRRFFFAPLEVETEDGDTLIPSEATASRDGGFKTDAGLETGEAMEHIEDAMAALNESFRLAIGLHLKGMKPKKMAEVLGCTPGAASALLFRARKALARELGKEFLEEYGLCA